jgi:hypothetical protein
VLVRGEVDAPVAVRRDGTDALLVGDVVRQVVRNDERAAIVELVDDAPADVAAEPVTRMRWPSRRGCG